MGQLLKPPAVLELRSDLGGGKTTFVKGLVRGAKSKDIVTSPSFTLQQIYRGKNGTKIAHFDFYRLPQAGLMADDLAETLQDSKTITVVEWGKVVKDVLPPERIVVEFKPVVANDNQRQISISYPISYTSIIKKLEAVWR